MPTRLTSLVLLAMALCAVGARADDTGASMFSLRGFGTAGVVHSSEDKADFLNNFFQPDGAGFTRSWAPGVDSKLGVQLDTQLNDKTSVIVQIVSQHRSDSTWTPRVEWANLSYQFSPDFGMRVGRSVESSFMMSDTRLVGYTYPWVRPPAEVYGLFPITNADGLEAMYSFRLADAKNTLRGGYGRMKLKTPGNGNLTGKQFSQITDTVELGPSTFRLSYLTLRLSFDLAGFNALDAGFTQFGNTTAALFPQTSAQAFSIGNKYRFADAPYTLLTVGFNYDPGDWLLMTEWGKVNATAMVSDVIAGYVTGGYRVREFTPYLTLAYLKADRISEQGISTNGLPAPFAAGAAGLNAGLAAVINNFAWSQQTVSAGVRWDFMKNTDLKLQYDRLRTTHGSVGRLVNIQPGFQPGKAVNMISLAADFVF